MLKFLEEHKKISTILTLLLAVEIFWFSSLKAEDIGKEIGINYSSYIYHFSVFFLLAFFLISSIRRKNKLKTRTVIITLIITILYAISDEFHQYFIPGRSSGITDIITDSLGILCAMGIYIYIYKKKSKYVKRENIIYKVE